VGRFKAAFFTALDYSADRWEALRDDLLKLARAGPAAIGNPTPFGVTFEVDGILRLPRASFEKTLALLVSLEDEEIIRKVSRK
jgi:hypothetical protein